MVKYGGKNRFLPSTVRLVILASQLKENLSIDLALFINNMTTTNTSIYKLHQDRDTQTAAHSLDRKDGPRGPPQLLEYISHKF